jgi:hypothetical protein
LRQRTVSHVFSDEKWHDCRPPPTIIFSVSSIDYKTEADSQAVMNVLTKHDFQDAFKNDRSAGNGCYAEVDYLEGDVGQ